MYWVGTITDCISTFFHCVKGTSDIIMPMTINHFLKPSRKSIKTLFMDQISSQEYHGLVYSANQTHIFSYWCKNHEIPLLPWNNPYHWLTTLTTIFLYTHRHQVDRNHVIDIMELSVTKKNVYYPMVCMSSYYFFQELLTDFFFFITVVSCLKLFPSYKSGNIWWSDQRVGKRK